MKTADIPSYAGDLETGRQTTANKRRLSCPGELGGGDSYLSYRNLTEAQLDADIRMDKESRLETLS